MKLNIVILASLCYVAMNAHVKLGNYDPVTKTWSGYNPACEDQCKQADGVSCGSGVKKCCVKDQCVTKRGFKVCQEPAQFDCDQGKRTQQLSETLNKLGKQI